MIFTCEKAVRCPGSDSPVANLSAEAPDQLVFIGYNSGWDWNTVPLGGGGAPGPTLFCESPVSQEDADLCAANCQNGGTSANCSGGPSGDPTDPDTPKDPDGNPVQRFQNETIICTLPCPDGSTFSWGFAAGQITADSQIMANRIAQSFACKLARRNMICLGPLVPSTTCLGQEYVGRIIPSRNLERAEIVSGTLPDGLSLNGEPGLFFLDAMEQISILGTPTAVGVYNFIIRAFGASQNCVNAYATMLAASGVPPTPVSPATEVSTTTTQSVTVPTSTEEVTTKMSDSTWVIAGQTVQIIKTADQTRATFRILQIDSDGTIHLAWLNYSNDVAGGTVFATGTKVFALDDLTLSVFKDGWMEAGQEVAIVDPNQPTVRQLTCRVADTLNTGTVRLTWLRAAGDAAISTSNVPTAIPSGWSVHSLINTPCSEDGSSQDKDYTITVWGITNTPPGGEVGTAYSFQFTAGGGTAPYTYALEGGFLPDGLTLSSGGLLSGTPTVADAFDFDVRVTDADELTCVYPWIVVISASTATCPDWPSLDWATSLFNATAGAGSESHDFTPASGGAGFDVTVTAPDSLSGDQAVVQSTPTLAYSAGPCNCTAHVVVTKTGLPGIICGGLVITDDLANTYVSLDVNGLGAGTNTFDFPFTVVAGTTTLNVTLQAQVPCLGTDGSPISLHITGYIKNV